ncbi:MAG: M56 family metallopeptidase, partial [Candidatus Rokuibacteriota bacterium]
MMRETWPRRPDRLAWVPLSALVAVAAILTVAAWVALRAENWGGVPQRLLNACLLAPQLAVRGSWAWATTHPFTAAMLGVLVGSLGWALVRLARSLWNGWQVGRQLSRYQGGRFTRLDGALRLTPEVDPARVRIVPSVRPGAFSAGLLRQRICLSVGLIESLTETELASVLRHENAHVTARDPMRLAAVRLLSDFLWFLPITPVLAETFSGHAELRADEAAVGAGSDPVELASAIVKAARGALSAPALAPALGGLGLVER